MTAVVICLTALVVAQGAALVAVVTFGLRHVRNLEELALMDQKERRAYLDMATATESQLRDHADPDVGAEEESPDDDIEFGNIRWKR
ncbi:MAG: hypothetical protein R6U98_06630 [Pirellulaceae bacterium]